MSNEMIKPSVTLAIDLGATNLRVGLVKIDEKGMPFVVDVIRDSSAKDNPTVLYHEITTMIDQIIHRNPTIKFTHIGVSLCGLVENGRTATKLPNLHIEHFELADWLERDYPGVKVLCANDANCAALSEAIFGSASDVNDSYYITVSSGIGGGYVYQKQLINTTLEIGHCVREFEGKLVEQEQYLSGNGLARLAAYNGLENMKAADIFNAVRESKRNNTPLEPKIKKTYEDWYKGLGLLIANLQLEFNLDKIVLAGGVMKSSDVFMDDLFRVASAFAANYPLKPIRFVLAKFDQDSGLVGAATVGFSIKD